MFYTSPPFVIKICKCQCQDQVRCCFEKSHMQISYMTIIIVHITVSSLKPARIMFSVLIQLTIYSKKRLSESFLEEKAQVQQDLLFIIKFLAFIKFAAGYSFN